MSWKKDKELASQYFLANLSHQIRNPIGGIVGHTQLLLQTKLDHTQKTYIDTINHCCIQLAELVNDILDFSKLASGKVQLNNECFTLTELINEIESALGCRLKEKNQRFCHAFSKEIPEYIVSDKQKLSQILINLVSNANKFTPNGGRIIVSAIPHTTENEIEFMVEDNGIGICLEDQKKLFNPFIQVHDSVKGGSGLGLAIAKKLVQLLGGDIKVESELNEGAIFTFTVKYEKYDDFEKSIQQNSDVLKNKYILIIDENVDNRVSVGDILFEFGARPIICSSVKEGIKMLGKGRYPFSNVLVSSNTGSLTITETVNQIKKINNELSLICMLGEEQFDTTIFDYVIEKPINRIKLVDILCKAIKNIDGVCLQLNKPEIINKDKKDLKLLVVEDEIYNLNMLCKMLNSMGYTNIDTASTGEDAVVKLEHTSYDIMLLDLKMPKGDGFFVAEYVKNKKINILISVITASVLESDKDRCKDLGIKYFLLKPFNMTHLRMLIHKLLNGTN